MNDLSKARSMEQTWDKLAELNPLDPKTNKLDQAYIDDIESDDTPQSSEDENLSTAYTLLASHGLDSAIGQMMAHYAEQTLPHTQLALYRAYEKAKNTSNAASQRFANNLRGMIIFTYAWSYVMARVKQLVIKDDNFYAAMSEVVSTSSGSEDRAKQTSAAENKLETTLGLLLHALENSKRSGTEAQRAFFEGSLLACYSLSNMYYGKHTTYVSNE